MNRVRTGPRRRRDPAGPTSALAMELRQRRLALGLTQQAVADLADLGRGTVLELESGRGRTSLAAAAAVAEVLGMTLSLAPLAPGGDRDR